MKKIFYSFILLLMAYNMASAQVIKAELQAAGLTCSMCSRATDKQLRSLDFIDSVGIDLSRTVFILYFKKDKTVDFNQIKKKVEDAGFSVAELKVTYKFDNLKIENGSSFVYGNSRLYFVNVTGQTLNGDGTFKIIDKGFVSPKEYKNYANQLSGISKEATNTNPIYHITLQL